MLVDLKYEAVTAHSFRITWVHDDRLGRWISPAMLAFDVHIFAPPGFRQLVVPHIIETDRLQLLGEFERAAWAIFGVLGEALQYKFVEFGRHVRGMLRRWLRWRFTDASIASWFFQFPFVLIEDSWQIYFVSTI